MASRLKELPRAIFGGVEAVGFEAGSVSDPSVTRHNDDDTGVYWPAANVCAVTAGGVDAARFNTLASGVNYHAIYPATAAGAAATGVRLAAEGASTHISVQLVPKGTGQVLGPLGAVGTPSYSFVGRITDGIYSPAANQVGIASTGSLAAFIEATAGVPAAATTKAVLTLGATALVGGSASGTYLGLNAVVGYGGALLNLQQNGVSVFGVPSIANAVNGVSVQTAATGVVPAISAIGSDANVGLLIQPKGTGSLVMRTGGGATGNVYLQVWNGGAFADLVTGVSNASPTLTLAATGGVTVTQQLRTGANLGAAGTGVTAVEYGDGTIHQTVLTLNLTGANDLDIADGADAGDSAAIYTFPEGRILVLGVTTDLSSTVNSVFEATPNDVFDIGIGTAAAGADATLSGTEQDLAPKQTNDTASSVTLTHAYDTALAVSAQFDGTGGAVVAYLNAAAANASLSGALTIAVTGTVKITWINLGDY